MGSTAACGRCCGPASEVCGKKDSADGHPMMCLANACVPGESVGPQEGGRLAGGAGVSWVVVDGSVARVRWTAGPDLQQPQVEGSCTSIMVASRFLQGACVYRWPILFLRTLSTVSFLKIWT